MFPILPPDVSGLVYHAVQRSLLACPVGVHGIGRDLRGRRTLAMGVVKDANDIEAFYVTRDLQGYLEATYRLRQRLKEE